MYPSCIGCIHNNRKPTGDHNIFCKAFPEGVPNDILAGTNPHLKVHPDQDNDIIFEPINFSSID